MGSFRDRFRRRTAPPAPAPAPSPTQLAVDGVPFWWHSIDVGDGVVTPGHKTPEILADEIATLELGDLTGRSVLDVGAWDGGFSFAAERAGAARIVALDHFIWEQDLTSWDGRPAPAAPTPPADPALPGRVGFETAHRLLGSRVEPVHGEFATVDPAALGRFDVVLFLGVLYHLEDPFGALRRLTELVAPGGICLVETHAILTDEPERTLWEFYPGADLGGDPTNWWGPSLPALTSACTAAGFASVDVLRGPPPGLANPPGHYRAIVRCHAPAVTAGP
jgi:tRNA (mo5U34)-methyltransferase